MRILAARGVSGLLGLSLLAACGGGATDAGAADAAPADGIAAQAPAARDHPYLLDGPVPPDPCAVLDEAMASSLLGGTAAKRPGAGGTCTYQHGVGSDAVTLRLHYFNLPVDWADQAAADPELLASLLGTAVTPADDVSGLPAFTAEKGGASTLLTATGVYVTAVTSDRVVGEVMVQASLGNAMPHGQRIETLRPLAEAAADHLRQTASSEGENR